MLARASTLLAEEPTPEKLILEGHWKRARTVVERRLRETPEDANSNFLWSQICNALGDRTSPPGLAEKALRLDGSVARYHRQVAEVQGVMAQRSNVFQQVGQARRFRKEIETALELDPRDVQARRDLVEFYLVAPGILGGDAKKAEVEVQQIAAIDRAEGFLAQARIAELRKDYVRAGALLHGAAALRPPSYRALMALADFSLASAHRDEAAAEAAARAALAIDAGRAGAYSILASIYAGRPVWAELEAVLTAAAKEVPDDLAPYYRAAERLIRDGRDPARSERYLRIYLTQETEGNEPTLADARWQLGLALRAQGQEASALAEWKAAVRLDPDSPAARELKRSGKPAAN